MILSARWRVMGDHAAKWAGLTTSSMAGSVQVLHNSLVYPSIIMTQKLAKDLPDATPSSILHFAFQIHWWQLSCTNTQGSGSVHKSVSYAHIQQVSKHTTVQIRLLNLMKQCIRAVCHVTPALGVFCIHDLYTSHISSVLSRMHAQTF